MNLRGNDALRKKMADLGKDRQAEPSAVVPKKDYDLFFRLLLMGDTFVGKSCVMMTYSNDAFTDPLMGTIGKRGHVFNLTFLVSSLPSLSVV